MEVTTAASFVNYFESVRARTKRVVQCVPADRLEWSHREGAFAFGDLIRHLAATERWMFAENVSLRPSRYPGHGRELAYGYDAVMTYFGEMHAQSVQIFGALTPEDLDKRCVTPAGTEIGVRKWLRAMEEHEIHHRGQIYLMLGMLGIPTPPMYGLTSEQVRARSIGD